VGRPPAPPAAAAAAAAAEAARDAWRQSMRARGAHRDDYSLVAGLRTREARAAAVGSFGLLSQQASLGINLIAAVATACIFGYLVGRQLFGPSSAAPWVGAVACGAGMLGVEASLAVIRLSRIDASRGAAPPPGSMSAAEFSFGTPGVSRGRFEASPPPPTVVFTPSFWSPYRFCTYANTAPPVAPSIKASSKEE
jgi:hypothetical protein